MQISYIKIEKKAYIHFKFYNKIKQKQKQKQNSTRKKKKKNEKIKQRNKQTCILYEIIYYETLKHSDANMYNK